MHIDGCTHSFADLASSILPGHMARLRAAMDFPRPATEFHDASVGPTRLARKFGLPGDFSGCYVLLDEAGPVYVGISRQVLGRLRQHFLGKTHFDASLVYKIARERHPITGRRSASMKDAEFQLAFATVQGEIRQWRVAFVEIVNPVELYLFEVFAAMELSTYRWNTFRTH